MKKRYLDDEEADAPTFAIVIKDGPFGVDLRELHQELESKRQFGNWVDEKLSQFVKGEDFEEVFNNPVKNSVGRPRKDYAISIELAKHIAMMENTERGKQVRQYFIECEKALKGLRGPTIPAIPQTLGEALRLAADLSDKNEAQALQLEVQKPAVEFVDNYCNSKDLSSIRDTAKKLGIHQVRFINICLEIGVLYRKKRTDGRTGPLQPYSQWMLDPDDHHVGLDYLRAIIVEKADGSPTTQTMFTPKGVVWISRKIKKHLASQGQN